MRKLLYEITHTTTYDYMGIVSVSHHLVRLGPRHYSKQHCIAYELTVCPQAATINLHRDYFGNLTHFVAVEAAHQQLIIKSQSRVAVLPAFIPEPLETPPWETV